MKVHLIKKQSIEEYATQNSMSRVPFSEWLTKVKYADWNNPMDILNTFPSADLLGDGSERVIFDIGGNNYRLIGKYFFGNKQVHLFICWIGTHAEYDKICKDSKQYTINIF
ncbi:MAG: type II toxin-antitoxin system HigB family toxin [Chitinophagaceae bacterium]